MKAKYRNVVVSVFVIVILCIPLWIYRTDAHQRELDRSLRTAVARYESGVADDAFFKKIHGSRSSNFALAEDALHNGANPAWIEMQGYNVSPLQHLLMFFSPHKKPIIRNIEPSALFQTITLDNYQMMDLMVRYGVSPNTILAEDELSLLQLAAKNGSTRTAQYLLERGANPNLKDGWGRTALHYAIYTGHAEISDLLRKAGGVE